MCTEIKFIILSISIIVRPMLIFDWILFQIHFVHFWYSYLKQFIPTLQTPAMSPRNLMSQQLKVYIWPHEVVPHHMVTSLLLFGTYSSFYISNKTQQRNCRTKHTNRFSLTAYWVNMDRCPSFYVLSESFLLVSK